MDKYIYYVYIIASKSGTLYIGITNDLERRIYEHKNKLAVGFSSKYNCNKLLYYEEFDDVSFAITREKQLKNWSRKKKVFLIKKENPGWRDLSEEWSCSFGNLE